MKTYLIIVLFVAVCLLAGSTPAFAHHGTGISYDLSKLVSVKGVVVKFALSNPHSQLYFDVTDDKGNVEHFGNPHSEDMHLQERYHRLNRDTLEIVVTIDDPKTYTKSWVSDKLTFRLQANDRIREDFCVPSEEESFNQGVRNPAGGVFNK